MDEHRRDMLENLGALAVALAIPAIFVSTLAYVCRNDPTKEEQLMQRKVIPSERNYDPGRSDDKGLIEDKNVRPYSK